MDLPAQTTLGSSVALFGAKYARPFPQENKNLNNLKVTVLK